MLESFCWQEEASDLDSEKKVLAAGLNDEERTSEYFLVRQQLERTRAEVCRVIQRPENCLPYIQVKIYGKRLKKIWVTCSPSRFSSLIDVCEHVHGS